MYPQGKASHRHRSPSLRETGAGEPRVTIHPNDLETLDHRLADGSTALVENRAVDFGVASEAIEWEPGKPPVTSATVGIETLLPPGCQR